jgi:hypothetical protein
MKKHINGKVPCVLFAYDRPDTFIQVVSALRTQDVDHVIVFIDGPKNDKAVGPVGECKKIAQGIDWVSVDCSFKEKNEGPAGIVNNIATVFQSYNSAIFLEDDCLPMPSFYSVVKRALRYYEEDKRVFSIGGYQQIQDTFFTAYQYSLVSSARFTGWGWATWRDRWDMISPHFSRDGADLKSYKNIPGTAGDDLVSFARDFSRSRKKTWETSPAWDVKIAILTLFFRKVHLLPTKGLIKNIGLNSGFHFIPDRANDIFFNRNVYDRDIGNITWPDDTGPHDEYNKRLKESVDTARNYFLEKAASSRFEASPITLRDVFTKAPHILDQMRNNPVRTIKKIFFRVFRRPINALLDFRKRGSLAKKR